ncbi:ATP-dependent Clp protease proteolytic subunit [Dysosmobacter sp. Marseille-Q4140]|nr:ATP-dependent Clp protease proteolytic subunit [Dysosmobacter sp. Marseille-Q4140]
MLREKARDPMSEQTKACSAAGENNENTGGLAQQIVDFGSALTRTPHGSVYCLTIIGQIEGHSNAPDQTKTTKYEHVLPLLAKLEEAEEVDGVLFLLNTVGGDVEAGLAIAELIAGMTKPTVSIVLGGSHSIGVPLAVAARRSFAVPSAAMTIHPVRMSGTVIAAPQTYSYFQRLQERIVAFVSGHSRISAEDFQTLMLRKDDMAADVGSVLYGEEAVRVGLIDEVGGLSDGLQCLYRQIEQYRRTGD